MKKILAAALICSMLLAGVASAVPAVGQTDADPVPDELTLTADSHLILDREAGTVDGIDGKITAKKLKANFEGAVSVSSPAGVERADSEFVCTDDIVSCGTDISAEEESLRVVIYGDVNRDGEINLIDAVCILKAAAGQSIDFSAAAADVDKSGGIDAADAVKLLRCIAGWENISLGNVRMVAVNEKITAPAEDSDIDLFFTSPMRKVGRSETESSGVFAYKMMMARNETESAQVFLTTAENKEGLTAEFSDFEYEFGDVSSALTGEVLREYYYNLGKFYDIHKNDMRQIIQDYQAEPLLPNAGEFELRAGRSQGFMLNVTAAKDAAPGMYRAKFNVKDSDGNVVKSAYVYAYVWDFTLPDGTLSDSAFGLDRKRNVVYEEYYECLLDYNMTPSEIPYDLLDPRADAYMNDPRVTTFRTCPEFAGYALTAYFGEGNIGYGDQIRFDPDAAADKLVKTMAKINANEVWRHKSYFTIIDEPWGKDMFHRVRNFDEWMQDVLGNDDYNLMLCLGMNSVYDEITQMDALEFLTPYIDMWCPATVAYTRHTDKSPGAYYYQYTGTYMKYGDYIDRRYSLMDEGDRLWWYVVGPDFPYPSFLNYYDGIVNRMILWQQYMFDIEGILFWGTNSYADDVKLNDYGAGSGDAQMLYTGEIYGLTGPVPGYRMVQLRDSFDDFDYLTIAGELLGRDAALEVLYKVTRSILDFTEDPDVLESARRELGQMIEDAMAAQK